MIDKSLAPLHEIDRAAEAAIGACGGDLNATIKTLVADNLAMERELRFASVAMSFGFARGWFTRQRERLP